MTPKRSRTRKGQSAYRTGHRIEWLALFWLMLKGYRILGFRLKTPGAEIDLLAVSGTRLVVVEVKARRTLNEALEALGPDQQTRLLRAATDLIARHPRLAPRRAGEAALKARLDLIAFCPGHWPVHVRDIGAAEFR